MPPSKQRRTDPDTARARYREKVTVTKVDWLERELGPVAEFAGVAGLTSGA